MNFENKSTEFGFLGTMMANYGLDKSEAVKMYTLTLNAIKSVGIKNSLLAESFLDSKWGRHLADQLSYFGAKQNNSILDFKAVLRSWSKSGKNLWILKAAKEL